MPPRGDRLRLRRWILWLAGLGMAADLDLLVGVHNAQSHSLGAALLVGATGAFLLWRRGTVAGARDAVNVGVVLAAAYGSHVLLDWLNSDTTPPIGVMALWPLDGAHYQSRLFLFHAISRHYDRPDFWQANLSAVIREVVLLTPPCLVGCWWLTRQRRP